MKSSLLLLQLVEYQNFWTLSLSIIMYIPPVVLNRIYCCCCCFVVVVDLKFLGKFDILENPGHRENLEGNRQKMN